MRAFFCDTQRPTPADLTDAFVISDTHFNHVNIQTYEPIRQTLGGDHNDVMIERWQNTVGHDDVVLHLGDLCLGRPDDFTRIAVQLPGRKLLIKGNHDKLSDEWYANHGFEVISPLLIEHGRWLVFVDHEPTVEWMLGPDWLQLHGHVHSKSRIDRRFVNMSVEVIDFTPQRLRDVLNDRVETIQGKEG